MRVLITGGSGFLGQSILSYLLKNTKDEIYTLSRSNFDYKNHKTVDLLDIGATRLVMEQICPDLIFHCAGNPSNNPDNENPSGVLNDNIIATNNLLASCTKTAVFINISSVTVFGNFSKESPAYYLTETDPISVYAASKLACENLVNVYTKQKRVRGISVRIPALVGKSATHGLLKDLVYKLKSDSKKLLLFGVKPGSVKPYQHVDDIAELISKIGIYFNDSDYNKFVIIGNEDSLSVEQVARLVMDELGLYKEIEWSGQTWIGDNNKIYLLSDLHPKLNSEETIVKYLGEIS